MKIYVSNGQQTAFDVALMQYGSLDGLSRLLKDNPGLILEDGTFQKFNIPHFIDPKFSENDLIKSRMLVLVPCTGDIPSESDSLLDDDDSDGLLDDSGDQLFDA